MFYSERLISKTGPLARVWLAANIERKLTKSQVLQSDLQSNCDTITDQVTDRGQEPLALRFTGQLMLGVVRIYGKKAKYLQDDCHEALLKIRMTFKNTGNHDLPANATTGLDLNLPELLTIDDLFPSMDFTYPMTQQPAIEANQDYDQDWTSTLNPHQSTQSRLTPDNQPLLNDEDLGLDFGDDFGPNDTTVSINVGRNAPAPRALDDEVMGGEKIYEDDDLVLDLGEDDVPMADAPPQPNIGLDINEPDAAPILGEDNTFAQLQPQREDSPQSDAGSTVLRNLDNTFAQPEEEVSEIAIQQRQQSRKTKAIVPDAETVLHNRQIKAQAEDRSKILKAPSFLPRDPFLLALMEMQKNGDFVTMGMNDGRSKNWALELQGLLSFDVVHRSGQKRKRDSGVAGLSEDEHSEKSPRLDLDEMDEGVHIDAQLQGDDIIVPIGSDGPALADMVQGEDEEGIFATPDDHFDETTMPILHPAESGPVSLGTKRAVHLLRDKFGSESDGSPSSQMKKSVLLQDLVPEKTTTKEDATKMFFEVLVLATKDAIKVEQGEKHIGLPLRIRGKRGLWGSWADEEIGEDGVLVQAAA